MKKSKGIVVLLLTLILTVFFCFTAAVGIGPTGTGAAKHINTGLDLAGGVSITYQAKESNPTSEEMSCRRKSRLDSGVTCTNYSSGQV